VKRSSSIYLKGLITTGKQDQEQRPWFTANDLGGTVAINNIYFMTKTITQQNLNPNKSDGG
jgi:hypothetical protein